MNIHASMYVKFGGNLSNRKISSTKFPTSRECSNGDAEVRNLEIARSRAHIDQFVSTFTAVKLSVYCAYVAAASM
jgi:hypothetical protein